MYINTANLPNEGFIGIEAIIGRPEITPDEAAVNRRLAMEAKSKGKLFTKPRRARPAIQGVLPVGRTFLYAKIREGVFPPPVKFGHRSVWDVQEVRRALVALAKQA